jgi:hypothetical protein
MVIIVSNIVHRLCALRFQAFGESAHHLTFHPFNSVQLTRYDAPNLASGAAMRPRDLIKLIGGGAVVPKADPSVAGKFSFRGQRKRMITEILAV